MARVRGVRGVWKAAPTIEGAGVHLKRAFGHNHVPQMDPFLLLDDFHSDRPADYVKGFPWHPHRGIETITYVLHGEVDHGDSMGNSGRISTGDVQWMTAGSGVVHQEMPRGNRKGLLRGLQLWANLPASSKMMSPRYRDVRREDIPVVSLPNGTLIRVICGRVGDTQGPVRDIVIDPEYLDITVPSGQSFRHATRNEDTVIAYVMDGSAGFGESGSRARRRIGRPDTPVTGKDGLIPAECLVLFDDGEEILVGAGAVPVRLLLISGRPLGEPVAWYGPIVMNTEEELQVAFDEYEKGAFIKPSAPSPAP